jgi:hypothetical protein
VSEFLTVVITGAVNAGALAAQAGAGVVEHPVDGDADE